MKIRLYITILWAAVMFVGCDDIAVGYLHTDEASYSMDTLRVTRFSSLEDNIVELESVFDQYTPEIQNLLAEIDQLEEEFFGIEARKNEVYEALKQARSAYYNAS